MVLLPKEPILLPPMRIYRGKDPELIEHPIKKTEDFLEKMDGFGDRLFWAFKKSAITGLFWSALDIRGITKITDRRMQIARTAFFTIPAVSAAIGYIALLEIAKKSYARGNRALAYATAAAVPAGVACVWRKRLTPFLKVFLPLGAAGALYGTAVDKDMYFGYGPAWMNPNDPRDHFHKSWSLFGESRRPEILTNPFGIKGSFWATGVDPGPTYAKFEKKDE